MLKACDKRSRRRHAFSKANPPLTCVTSTSEKSNSCQLSFQDSPEDEGQFFVQGLTLA
jgi:hypothetical protein